MGNKWSNGQILVKRVNRDKTYNKGKNRKNDNEESSQRINVSQDDRYKCLANDKVV